MLIPHIFYFLFSSLVGVLLFKGYQISPYYSGIASAFTYLNLMFSAQICNLIYGFYNSSKVIGEGHERYGYIFRITDILSKKLNIKTPKIVISDTVDYFAIDGDTNSSVLFVNVENIELFDSASIIGIISHELSHVKLNHTKFKSLLSLPFMYSYFTLKSVAVFIDLLIAPILNLIPIVSTLWAISQLILVPIFNLLFKLNDQVMILLTSIYYKLIEPLADRNTIFIGTYTHLIWALEKMDDDEEPAIFNRIFSTHNFPKKRINDVVSFCKKNPHLIGEDFEYSMTPKSDYFNYKNCALNIRNTRALKEPVTTPINEATQGVMTY